VFLWTWSTRHQRLDVWTRAPFGRMRERRETIHINEGLESGRRFRASYGYLLVLPS
jgi:hypothetical protein